MIIKISGFYMVVFKWYKHGLCTRRSSIKIECEYVKGKKSLKEKQKEGILCGRSDVRLALQIAQGPGELMLQNYYLKNILEHLILPTHVVFKWKTFALPSGDLDIEETALNILIYTRSDSKEPFFNNLSAYIQIGLACVWLLCWGCGGL